MSAMKKLLAIYSVLVGAAMVAMWCVFYALDAIPEVINKPWEITMHLTAEFITASLLILSGFGLLARANWANRVNLFASGMLVYTLIESPGYYLQRNAIAFVAMFALCLVATLLLSPAFKLQPPKPAVLPE
jgi:hypothetical protein